MIDAGVVYQDLGTKLSKINVDGQEEDIILQLEALNVGSQSTKTWFIVFTGDMIQTIRFTNLLICALENCKEDCHIMPQKGMTITVHVCEQRKCIMVELDGAMRLYHWNDLASIREALVSYYRLLR